jgi:hypothetical protein
LQVIAAADKIHDATRFRHEKLFIQVTDFCSGCDLVLIDAIHDNTAAVCSKLTAS